MSREIESVPERREPLKTPLLVSAAFHAALLAVSVVWNILDAPVLLGDPSGSLGGAVAVNPVEGIPVPQEPSARRNPVANPTRHEVPAVPPEPEAAAPEQPAPDEDAVPVEEKKKKRPTEAQKAAARSPEKQQKNQVGSTTGPKVSSPIYSGAKGGSGGVGFGSGSPFGTRFGWYAEALQRKLARAWQQTLSQVDGGASKPVVISFRILRDGAFEDIRLAESSGNRSLDYSALRAATYASPAQPLPRQLGRSSITVEMWFQLK